MYHGAFTATTFNTVTWSNEQIEVLSYWNSGKCLLVCVKTALCTVLYTGTRVKLNQTCWIPNKFEHDMRYTHTCVCVWLCMCVCVYSCMWMHVCMTVCMCVQLYVSVCMHVWLNKMNEWNYMYAAYKLHKTLHVNSTRYTQHIHVGSRKLKYQRNSYQVETAPTQPPPAELLETRRGRTAVASFASTNEKHYVFCINAMKKAYSIT